MTVFLQLFILGLMEGGLYAIVGVTVVLVYKATQVPSLAHGHIMAFGALLFYLFFDYFSLPLPIALPLTLFATAILGVLIDRLAIRPLIGQPQFSAFLVTFALFTILDGVFNIILKERAIGFPDFLPKGHLGFFTLDIPVAQLVSFISVLALFSLLGILFKYTKIGLGMLATAEKHQLAQSIGISVEKTFSLAWGLSAIVAALAGMATANIMDIYYPLPYIVIKGLIVALFGGLDSIIGALLGGLLLGILENVSAGYLDPFVGGGVREVAAYVMLLLLLLLRPYGLFGQVQIERI